MLISHLKPTITLEYGWISKQEWDEIFKDDLNSLIELLEEDWVAVFDEIDGLGGLIIGAEWKDEN